MSRESEIIDDQLRRNDVELLRGEASFVDPHTIFVQSGDACRAVTADNILIAVGTEPTPPPGVAPDGETVITSDGVIGLTRLPRSMAVVGGGVVGVEYASMFAALGIEVTLVERRERPLEFLDWEIVDELIHQMRNRNVTFRLGEAVERLELSAGPPRRAVILLESGKRIVSDLVLFSVGRTGATAKLNLAAAELSADERGRIKVDENFRTAVPHIFAAGDVIGYPSLAATSAEQGRLAACHAFGVPVGTMEPHFPIGIYAIPEISMVGATEHELTEKKVRTRAAWRATARSPAARSWETTPGCSRCCSTARRARCLACTSSAPARPSWSTSGRRCSRSTASSTISCAPSSTIRRWQSATRWPPSTPRTSSPGSPSRLLCAAEYDLIIRAA